MAKTQLNLDSTPVPVIPKNFTQVTGYKKLIVQKLDATVPKSRIAIFKEIIQLNPKANKKLLNKAFSTLLYHGWIKPIHKNKRQCITL